MKITSLEIDGYGVWSGLRLERLVEGLNVVYGPNEAGKTTLLQFIRSVLYGFSPERRRYLPPVHGGPAGGRIAVSGPAGSFQIERRPELGGAAGPDAEQLAIIAPDGTHQGEHTLQVILSGVDEATFNNVFAVGLREIQELGTLGDSRAAELLYNITAGLDRVSLVEVTRELETLRNRILDRGGGACQIVGWLADREQARQEIEELQSLSRRHVQLAGQRAHLDRDLARLTEEKDHTDEQVRVIELALAVADRWARRAALDDELALLGPKAPLPPDARQRLEAIKARGQKYAHRAEQFDRRREELRQESAGLAVSEPLARQAARIEALLEQQPWIDTIRSRVAALEQEGGQLRSGLAAQQQRLGLGPAADPAAMPVVTARAAGRLRVPAHTLRSSRRQWDEARRAEAAAGKRAAALDAQLEAALSARQETDLPAAAERAGALVAQLRRRTQIDQRLEQLNRCHEEQQEQGRLLANRQMLPLAVLGGLGGLFILGVLLLIVGVFFPASMTGSLGWALALLGLVGAGLGIGGKLVLDHAQARRLDAWRQQAHMLDLQIRQAVEERDVLEGQLPRGGRTLAERLAVAERELAAWEELSALDTRRAAARQEATATATRATQARREFRSARRGWREALAGVGLPARLTLDQVRRLAGRRRPIGRMRRRLQEIDQELGQRRGELQMLVGRVAQLVADCGVAVSASDPIEQLRQLAEALSAQQARAERREAIGRRLRLLRRHRSRLEAALARLKRRRRELFRECGAESEEEFCRRALESARAETLRRDHEALERDIAAAVGQRCAWQSLREQLDGAAAAGLDSRGAEARTRLATIDGQLGERLQQRGQIVQEMKALVEDRRLADKQLEAAVLDARIQAALKRWQTLAVTGSVMEQIRTDYEHQRQPETLREASGYLDRLTRGRYRRVWTPLEERALRVDDAEGRPLPVELLSRGTREQLFLALRLALAAYFARHGAVLPMVLDDVLVNFDAERARAAVDCLGELAAAGHQLLVFTCHEHIAGLFQSQRVPVTRLPGHAEGAHAPVTLEGPPPERPRRLGKSAAAPRKAAKPKPPKPEEEPKQVEPYNAEDLWEETDTAVDQDLGDSGAAA
ncbi:MAG: AAA family ATPase [Thermoguttaceae bacterium]